MLASVHNGDNNVDFYYILVQFSASVTSRFKPVNIASYFRLFISSEWRKII